MNDGTIDALRLKIINQLKANVGESTLNICRTVFRGFSSFINYAISEPDIFILAMEYPSRLDIIKATDVAEDLFRCWK